MQIILKEREEKKKAREGETVETDKDDEIFQDEHNRWVMCGLGWPKSFLLECLLLVGLLLLGPLNISRFTEGMISQECSRECYTVRGDISYIYMYAQIGGCMEFYIKKLVIILYVTCNS